MARYTGPKSKIARKFREAIYGPDKALERKNYPPGQHGLSKKRGKQSEYAIQLMEKQKAKYIYGVLEKQFENLFGKAHRKHGITGENLLKFLEARLDNTVYRLGIAGSRRAARQLVSHKHVLVNGDIVNIPSYTLRPGDVISVREKYKALDAINEAVATTRVAKYTWLAFDSAAMSGTFLSMPDRADIPENIKEQLIVELYSK
jgi:small subunit ribosomal protein S4